MDVKKDGDLNTRNQELPLVNRSGFPLEESTLNSMWNFVQNTYFQSTSEFEKLENEIRFNENLPNKPICVQPHLDLGKTVKEKVDLIQNFIQQLEYNHTGLQFFEIRKSRPISRLMEVAKEIIKQSLPIKCLEAVILGLYLTSGISGLDRFVISFKSQFGRHVHRHVVLGIHCGMLYGAIGLSRRAELMYKPLVFKTLLDLIMNYEKAYTDCFHKLRKVRISNPIPHDCASQDKIKWDFVTIPMTKLNKVDTENLINRFSREMRAMNTKGS